MRKFATTMVWIGGMALASFLVTYGLVDRLALSREWFVLGHVLVTGSLLGAYAASTRTTIGELVGDWRMGVAGAAVAGGFMISFVLMGPSSPRPSGVAFVWSIVWLGLVYATIDALLLSVFPVIVVARSAGGQGLLSPSARRLGASLAALAVSFLLITTYHLGFPEFRGSALVSALIGNGIMTLAYIATRSALSPVLSHIALHVAAVTYGYLNALPAPPHY